MSAMGRVCTSTGGTARDYSTASGAATVFRPRPPRDAGPRTASAAIERAGHRGGLRRLRGAGVTVRQGHGDTGHRRLSRHDTCRDQCGPRHGGLLAHGRRLDLDSAEPAAADRRAGDPDDHTLVDDSPAPRSPARRLRTGCGWRVAWPDARKGVNTPVQATQRRHVERTHAWQNAFERLATLMPGKKRLDHRPQLVTDLPRLPPNHPHPLRNENTYPSTAPHKDHSARTP